MCPSDATPRKRRKQAAGRDRRESETMASDRKVGIALDVALGKRRSGRSVDGHGYSGVTR